jgi:molybdopterin converting factor small subunit
LIRVRCYGHIGNSVGSDELTLDAGDIDSADLVERVRMMSTTPNPGFDRYNTLVMIADGDAFVPAGVRRIVRDGDRVALIPFSHGG